MPGSVLKELEYVILQLRGDVFVRWVKRAHKAALMQWRDRKAVPGVAARFEESNAQRLGYSRRLRKGLRNPFVKTGALRAALLKRKPRHQIRGGTVTTVLKWGGLSLNFLTKKYGARGFVPVLKQSQVLVREHDLLTRSGIVRRAPHLRVTSVTVRRKVPSGTSYASEFGRDAGDQAWIARAVEVNLRRIVKAAAFTKRGKLKSSVLQQYDDSAEAA